ncbi:hypothetical protein IGB42_01920 [Andreprevotia sp. IGB-42]|uniref:N4-gp56 family major capsid protein n=1 Tax=Andreprevotia sp. IGB-42 TaxID=2497473 RepID=UPI00135AA999|nr:N4-gp56 family major capsid protein [Andreprevotia sp. IGB-42]KAF0813569.1 hypothetical protein IGB42_01920 [Andreprevotia sp. IGB-42]
MATTTYGSIGTSTAGWMLKTALEHAAPYLVIQNYTKSLALAKNSTKTMNCRRPNLFPLVTTPLTEGVAPSAEAFSYTPVDIPLVQFGRVAELTDVVQDMAKEPALKEMSEILGEAMANTYEAVTYNTAKGGTSVFYANGGARNVVNTQITATLLRNATRLLRRNKARFIGQRLAASPNYATQPVGEAFFAFGHTDIDADLRAVLGSAFLPVEAYGASMKAEPYEVGKFENIRFILSPEFTPWTDAGGAKGSMKSTGGTSADVYPLVILGKDALATVALKGANAMTPYVLQPGEARGGDPIGQKGTVGFKSYFAAAILNDAWLTRIELAVSA